jgi:arginyl-tRNA--protein-N-Asp/Glu arginylyltransferase
MASNYFKTGELKLDDFNSGEITRKYNEGYVLTRLGKGVMNQTRSLRIDLSKFKLNSENKRILRKTEEIDFEFKQLPLKDYSWEIHKLGKFFYEQKGGRRQEIGVSTREPVSQRVSELVGQHESRITNHETVMSASKIKAMFNDLEEENMNGVFSYRIKDGRLKMEDSEKGARSQEMESKLESQRVSELEEQSEHLPGGRPGRTLNTDIVVDTKHQTLNTKHESPVGYCLVYKNSEILHYAYPFYDLDYPNINLGMGMMVRAVKWAKEQGLKYVYLGSVVTPESKYKLQFNGLEWFETETQSWSDNLDLLKLKLK